jgi:hypothetical protein
MITSGKWKPVLRCCGALAVVTLACYSQCSGQEPTTNDNPVAVHAGVAVVRPVLLPSIALSSGDKEAQRKPRRPERDDLSNEAWEVEVGAVFTRFRSSIYYASMGGFRSSLAYHWNDWLAAEGGVTTGFAPAILSNEPVKYLDYMGGIRVGRWKDQFSPWIHGQVGGAHEVPRLGSQNSVALKGGVGVDYRLRSPFSLRVQADWVQTRFFKETQNSFQASASVVIRFSTFF